MCIGRCSLKKFCILLSINESKQLLNARATLDVPITYSRMRFQPIMNAINSPFINQIEILNVFLFVSFQLEVATPHSSETLSYTNSHVCVDVCTAGFGHTGAKLSIAKTSENRRNRCYNERNNNRWTRCIFYDRTSQHVYTSTLIRPRIKY